MNRRVLTWVEGLLLLGTALIAGGHYVYYLYHWEWVRAQIAGTALVAVLVVGVAVLVLRRQDRLEHAITRRLDELGTRVVSQGAGDPARPASHAPAQSSDATGEPQFPWLAPKLSPPPLSAVAVVLAALVAATPAEPTAAVFIPVILGAGLVLSLVAGAVERLSGAVRRRDQEDQRPRGRVLLGVAAASVVGLGLLTATAWYTAHYRPVTLGEGATHITVDVRSQTRSAAAVDTVEVMGRYCARTAIDGVSVKDVLPDTDDSAVLVVSPLLDPQAQRRYYGCLQDANLDRHWLVVSTTELVPEEES